jgi:hypothetical protein
MGLSNFGKDTVAKTIGGDTVGITGTASATSATSLTGTGFTASVAGPPDTGGTSGISSLPGRRPRSCTG